MPILEVQHICKTFGDTQVLKDISFTLEKGEALSMIGTSGSGKTTLLRCLNFLETPTSGKILVNDKPVFDSETAGRMSEAQVRENRLENRTLVRQNIHSPVLYLQLHDRHYRT